MSLVFVFALGCALPHPSETGAPLDSGDSGDSGAPDDTDPAVPVDCDAVTGTGNVFLVGRGDLGRLVRPSDTPTQATLVVSLAGPDRLGRYYLVEPTGIVRRSDDGGCSWSEVGLLPGGDPDGGDTSTADTGGGPRYVYYTLAASPAFAGAWAYAPEHLYVSADGRDWEARTAPLLRAPYGLAIDPANPDRLRSYGAEGIVTSTDAATTWTVVPTPDIDDWYNAAFDAADIDRVALSRRGLWVATDGGATWTQREAERDALLAWDAGDLWELFRDPDTAAMRVRRSTDLGVTFADLPVEDEPDAGLQEFAANGGLGVVVGYRWADGGADVRGRMVLVTPDAPAVVHLVDGYLDARAVAIGEDRVLAVFDAPMPGTPD